MTAPAGRQTSGAPCYPFENPDGSRWDPPEELSRYRDERRIVEVVFDGAPAWLVTRYADIRRLLADPRFISYIPGAPMPREQANESGILFLMDGVAHARLRGVLSHALSARRVAALRPAVERLAVDALADLTTQDPPADLLRGYAGPLAAGTLSELLGVDLAERAGFESMISDVQALFGAPDAATAADNGEQLAEFLARLVADRRAAPGADLLSDLITTAAPDGRPLTDHEVHGLVFSLLGAGLISPTKAVLLATVRLLDDPAAADPVRRGSEQITAVVDELLRLDPAGVANSDRPMRATADVDVAGVRIAAGDTVVIPYGAANRDPAAFADPDALRLDRGANRHLSFGPGVHHCLGAALARLQLEVGLHTLFRELPRLAIANEPDSLHWQDGMLGISSLTALRIRW